MIRRKEQVVLRVLATTDIHMQLLGFDYIKDRPIGHHGLAGIATLIREAREEAAGAGMASILLDNGDLLQGTPLGKTLAGQKVSARHPVVRLVGALGYDALGLGNHDFDHGLPYLENLAAHVAAPVVCSNLSGLSVFRSSAVVPCKVPLQSGPLRIGIVSVLPLRTAQWNNAELAGRARIEPILVGAKRAVREVRAAGADIVLLLAHLGLEPGDEDARMLAHLPGVDAMILGHTHQRLPGKDHAGLANVDSITGKLGQRPSVMPGHDASDLAVMDLQLTRTAACGWQVSAHETTLRRNRGRIRAAADIRKIFAPAHKRTRARLARICGRVDRQLHSYFSLAAPTRTSALVANAKHRIISQALAGTDHEELPLLASAPAHMAGGRSGVGNFLHIPKGEVSHRHLLGLSPYDNRICALRLTGGSLRSWLEHAAGVFSQLGAGTEVQHLMQGERPTFDFDTVFGLEYTIDPTRPPGGRITSLRHQGAEVADTAIFVMATSSFRAAGGGGGAMFTEGQILCHSPVDLTTAIGNALAQGDWAFPLDSRPWCFDCPEPVSAVFLTAPEALAHLDDIAHLSPQEQGLDDRGFARVLLTL